MCAAVALAGEGSRSVSPRRGTSFWDLLMAEAADTFAAGVSSQGEVVADGRLLRALYEWALDGCKEDLVQSVRDEAEWRQIHLEDGHDILRHRKHLFWLETLRTQRADEREFSDALAWLESLEELLPLVGASASAGYASLHLQLRTQVVLHPLAGESADWKGAKGALDRLFPTAKSAKNPPSGDESVRYRALDHTIRAAQKKQAQHVAQTLSRHSDEAAFERIAAFVRAVKQSLPTPQIDAVESSTLRAVDSGGNPAEVEVAGV
eukprot:1216521-Prymnesium_polylepis.1